MTDTIAISNLCKSFQVDGRDLVVLQDLDLTVPAQEITVLLGRSGCGITTLLGLIGGFDQDYTCTISMPPKARTAMVVQEARLMPWLTVSQNIAFGLKKKETDPDKIKELILLTGLEGFSEALPRQLSGGMQQRTALARALALDPGFILMDEPFAALDHFTREKMQQVLLDIHKKNRCGILFVTHSIDEALAIADQIVILENHKAKKVYPVGSAWRASCTEDDRRALREEILSSIQF